MQNEGMATELAKVIHQARNAKNLTQGQLGDLLGVSRSAVWQWENGRTAPASDKLIELCAVLGVDLASATKGVLSWLQKGDDKPNNEPMFKANDANLNKTSSKEVRTSDADLQVRSDMPLDVPVLGVAVGGQDGYFLFNGEIIDYVRRPVGIAKARDVFAIYVIGNSMSPKYEEGEPVYLSKGRVPKIGDYVVVEFLDRASGETKALIKRLARRSASALTLEQFNPPKEIEVFTADVRDVYRVIPWGEVLGI